MQIEPALRDYLLSQATLREQLGGRHVYAGRIPRGVRAPVVVVLSRVATSHRYTLAAEYGVIETVVAIEVHARNDGAERKALDIVDVIRPLVSSYRGTWGRGTDQRTVQGCTIETGAMPVAVYDDASDSWRFRYEMDLRINHTLA